MQRLCCFPLSETPEVNVKVKCISSCCASDVKTEQETNESQETVTRLRKRSCCCKKKRISSKSQAIVEGGVSNQNDRNE